MNAMVQPAALPPAQAPGEHRPAFWRWVQLTERKLRDVAEDLGCSHQQVFFICLPWNDQRRIDPSDALKTAIETLTDGAVPASTAWRAPAEQDGGAA